MDLDPIAELCAILKEANIKPYWNTHYMSQEQRVRLFRARAAAYLGGRRIQVRHFDPRPIGAA